ncbi:multicilin isoform X1 [Clarias gariepinus]|uniref:multicilin isoform X1 n=1 Tax=Clarias gariepinus TaxID=13013 RepID=UPI00234E2882|nr:multicilin isoform X1 [Clarias gariepinus]
MDAVDPLQHYLGHTMEMNRQLHVCVQRKQEEISALKEKNAELKELLNQAEIYAAVLDVFTPQPANTSECVPHLASLSTPHTHACSSSAETSEWNFSAAPQPSWLESILNHTPPGEEEERPHRILSHSNAGVKRQLWPSAIDSSSSDSPAESPEKKSRLDQAQSGTVQVFGSFRGLQVLKATPSTTSDPWREGRHAFFRTSIREHSTVQTRVFPHGKTFTSHTQEGSCRFLWIPKQS